jgi:hypothetical protein
MMMRLPRRSRDATSRVGGTNPSPDPTYWRGGWAKLATLTAVMVAMLSVAVGSVASAATVKPSGDHTADPAAFSWFKPAPPPSGWRQLALPSGTAVLSYPPSLRPLKGDHGSVSAASRGPDGNFLVYVNATPQEGDEGLAGWAESRLGHLRGDDASSVHEESAAEGLAFRSGRGSCVIDDYVTKVGHNSFHEIACLVEGAKGGSVIVAAAPSPTANSVNATLERAVSSYLVR